MMMKNARQGNKGGDVCVDWSAWIWGLSLIIRLMISELFKVRSELQQVMVRLYRCTGVYGVETRLSFNHIRNFFESFAA